MDDSSKRLVNLEVGLAELRAKFDTALPHLSTHAQLEAVRSELSGQISGVRTELGGQISALETRLIKWIVGGISTGMAISVGVAQVVTRLFGSSG